MTLAKEGQKSYLSSLFVPSQNIESWMGAKDPFDSQEYPDQGWYWQWSCSTSIPALNGPKNEEIILNVVTHPEYLSPILTRADIIYDSNAFPRRQTSLGTTHGEPSAFQKRSMDGAFDSDPEFIGGFVSFHVTRKLILRNIPRNPQRDKSMDQSIWVYTRLTEKSADDASPGSPICLLVVLVPHINKDIGIPYYFPTARAVTIEVVGNNISIYTLLHRAAGECSSDHNSYKNAELPCPYFHSDRSERMLNKLKEVLLKHLSKPDYIKRVNHDTIISRERYQTVYQRLKSRHSERLCRIMASNGYDGKGCREVDKLFEELGIASFCICLWEEMYDNPTRQPSPTLDDEESKPRKATIPKRSFVGFVDLGCGSGVLTDVLIHEGWPGYGFDARRRKAWKSFEENVQEHLFESVLVPYLVGDSDKIKISLDPNSKSGSSAESNDHTNNGSLPASFYQTLGSTQMRHSGIFPEGTFIICNHGDELTAWTPLLASLTQSPFLVIPCCSFNLSGKRFRAEPSIHLKDKRDQAKKSTYQSLIRYVEALCEDLGVLVEKEWLRIPSTRNLALVGRTYIGDPADTGEEAAREREARVLEIIQREGAADGYDATIAMIQERQFDHSC